MFDVNSTHKVKDLGSFLRDMDNRLRYVTDKIKELEQSFRSVISNRIGDAYVDRECVSGDCVNSRDI